MAKRSALCGCRNHLGKPKQQHATRQAAVEQILRWHLPRGGGIAHEVYPCPKRPGVWHVRSIR